MIKLIFCSVINGTDIALNLLYLKRMPYLFCNNFNEKIPDICNITEYRCQANSYRLNQIIAYPILVEAFKRSSDVIYTLPINNKKIYTLIFYNTGVVGVNYQTVKLRLHENL